MATTKPRITVTLTQRQHDVLRVISECGGSSMSAFISEILEQSLPVLERMAESFRKIKAAQDEQKKRIIADLDQAQAEVEPVLDQVLGQFDLFMAKIERAAGAAETSARADGTGAPAAVSTPVTNRGVTPSPSHPPKRPRRKASEAISSPKVSSKKSRG